VYQSGFDPAWAEREPGMTVMNDAVRAAIGEDAEEFDMLLGGESYKQRFVSDARAVHTVSLVGAVGPTRVLISTEATARRRGRQLARRAGIGRVLHAVARRLPGG
jgi:CelD/BcsL family acetyltransferase involved in cellulose biosynthesis